MFLKKTVRALESRVHNLIAVRQVAMVFNYTKYQDILRSWDLEPRTFQKPQGNTYFAWKYIFVVFLNINNKNNKISQAAGA